MSHRVEQKKARRAERERKEEEARRLEARHRLLRRATYASVVLVAATLIALAVLLGGNGPNTPAPVVAESGGSGPAIGANAPAFALTNVVSGSEVTRDSLRGRKTLLFFSEGVACQACMVQAADLEKKGALRKAGIRLVSVTTDAPSELAEAARQYGITTPLLADPTTEMSNAYGMLGHGGMGHPTADGHAFMLLDADGTVLWHRAYQEMYVDPETLMSDMGVAVRS